MKEVEGCSEKSIKYYKSTIENMLKTLDKPVKHITTEDLRGYLAEYHKKGNCSKVSIDKEMPIEQVQQLLGHQKIDTTLQYSMVSQNKDLLAFYLYH
ncbi:Site-specific recombinase XerD [Clostridium putrefaciens]|uniref:Site-specific recombinase XerD n=1 Tax=Clostridium putrefaciens TaxID=99675 RepID=A0A381J4V5_9CLOT|nr:phage integrase N-terminal SAM-like domain-containing protein [Clostridium putrefaciens]SUY45501.1 Site-specific recombinase XerD [Clostridium putrefaciens]